MLSRLTIQGLSILSDVRLDLGPGLNVLSGEPGSGKSLLLVALGLLCGGKAPPGLVREGEREARVVAGFTLGAKLAQAPALSALGLAAGECVLERVVARRGRSGALVNGRALPLSSLAAVARSLLTITAQHAHVALTDPRSFVKALDAEHGELAAEYAAAHAELVAARTELAEARALVGRGDREARMLREDLEQLSILERLEHGPGRVRERLSALRASEQIAACSARLRDALTDRDTSIDRELRALLSGFERLGPLPLAERVRAELELSLAALSEAARHAARLDAELSHEPYELERLEEQERALNRLSRRHGCEPEELSLRQRELGLELERLEGAGARALAAEQLAETWREQALALARSLHARRAARALELERRLAVELEGLGLGQAKISFQLSEREPEALDTRGLTELCMMFAANVGERPAELGRIASGGERARVLLALRCAGVDAAAPTLVLDEIDAGLGGAALEAMALRLASAARGRQILCVTHHANVAAQADLHCVVRKFVAGGRTEVEIRRLGGEDRVLELARMIAGGQAQGVRPLARRLLEQARQHAQSAA